MMLMTKICRLGGFVAMTILLSVAMAACGSGRGKYATAATAAATVPSVSSHSLVVRVGTARITRAEYDHWMAVGEATVEMPKPTGPLPSLVVYVPPKFTACVAHLRASGQKSTTAHLTARCKRTFEGIQRRIVNFLVTGYWLRGEADAQGVSVSPREVRRKFQEERRANYTPTSFRRLQEASHQTIADLEFAVETQMLSAKLLAAFKAAHPHEISQEAIAAFNASIKKTWVPQTNCTAGYVIPDCKQYHPTGKG
jgi:hypothetical protein